MIPVSRTRWLRRPDLGRAIADNLAENFRPPSQPQVRPEQRRPHMMKRAASMRTLLDFKSTWSGFVRSKGAQSEWRFLEDCRRYYRCCRPVERAPGCTGKYARAEGLGTGVYSRSD